MEVYEGVSISFFYNFNNMSFFFKFDFFLGFYGSFDVNIMKQENKFFFVFQYRVVDMKFFIEVYYLG